MRNCYLGREQAGEMIPLFTAEDPMTCALSLSEVDRHVVSLQFPFINIVEYRLELILVLNSSSDHIIAE